MIENNVDIFKQLGLSVPEAKKKDELGQEQFLKLMTTQLQNQDPFKPMESGDFLGQIAQFSTVSGIGDLNESFASFSGSLVSNQALQASTLVGRTVTIPTDFGTFNGELMSGVIDVPFNTDNLQISIEDSSGVLVKQVELGQQSKGQIPFYWDGLTDNGEIANPGKYRLKASVRSGSETEAAEVMMDARVESITLGKGGQGLTLNITGYDPVGFDQVQQVK
jgi:flagellar basal-body rod modification protein FlgD